MTNPDAVIKIVEFKIMLKIAELRMKPELDCPFSEARQPPYIHKGNPERLSNISEISKQLLINESEEIPESSFQNSMMNQMINQKENE